MGKELSSAASEPQGFKFVGCKNFFPTNPRSDHFAVRCYHHVEFWCGDATNTARRFSWGLGMPLFAKSDLSTGNSAHASYLLRSGHLNLLFTAPYSHSGSNPSSAAIPSFSSSVHTSFTSAHGLGVRAVGILVDSAFSAYSAAISRGAKPSSPPVLLSDNRTAIAEVYLYGDVVLRFVSYGDEDGESETTINSSDGYFLPGFEPIDSDLVDPDLDFGIRRLDHTAGIVPKIAPVVDYLMKFTGFHQFAEFPGEDVESDLNSMMLANNDENVIFPLSEPVPGAEKKMYLEHNGGAGVHHVALISEDIFRTLREMKKTSFVGGFEFMPPPPSSYYKDLKKRAGGVLTDEQIADCEKLGILVDWDGHGALLQIFTKPVGDRYSETCP